MSVEFETILYEATKLPMVKVDRELFLRKELRNKYDKEIVNLAIEYNPAYAGIPIKDIDEIAKSCIKGETRRVTSLSTVAGIPGGFAIIGTVPADLAQFLGHVLRIMQELLYLYGWKDIQLEENELDEETKNLVTLFVGVMCGVSGATTVITKVSESAAVQIAKKLPQKALTKGILYPIIKKIAVLLGVRMTKEIYAKGIAKIVPVAGGVVSGAITYSAYKPMAKKLQTYLREGKLADNEYMRKIKESDEIIYDAN